MLAKHKLFRNEVSPLKMEDGTEPQYQEPPEYLEEAVDLTWDPQFYIDN
jgi:hypothetical protein